ncbi:hypothetical protein C8Q73DRAFT_12267 [Cubamyces lactineus]|nr:hypothetical protein C8Q73DRAFT_12267 [Cubamyces lactineus]
MLRTHTRLWRVSVSEPTFHCALNPRRLTGITDAQCAGGRSGGPSVTGPNQMRREGSNGSVLLPHARLAGSLNVRLVSARSPIRIHCLVVLVSIWGDRIRTRGPQPLAAKPELRLRNTERRRVAGTGPAKTKMLVMTRRQPGGPQAKLSSTVTSNGRGGGGQPRCPRLVRVVSPPHLSIGSVSYLEFDHRSAHHSRYRGNPQRGLIWTHQLAGHT